MGTILYEVASRLLEGVIERVNSSLLDTAQQMLEPSDAAEERRMLEEEVLVKAYAILESLTTDKAWQQWAGQVFGICYDVGDLLDDLEHSTNNTFVVRKLKSLKRKRSTQQVQDSLEKIISNMESMNKIQRLEQQCQRSAKKAWVPASMKLVGREEEKDKIVSMLLDDQNSSVNIVGMGGLGKTTLAWHVKSDSRIQEKFDHNIKWVSVTAEFDTTAVAESILQRTLEYENTDKIQSLMEESYAGKSVLIVLDGLWDVTCDDWKYFKSWFEKTCCWKVLVTTRNQCAAFITGATVYTLPFMRYDDCRALVNDRVLSVNNLLGLSDYQLEDLEENVKEIARMSKGLPLAACTLGQSLSRMLFKGEDCKNLVETDIYDTREFKEKIFPGLKLIIPRSQLVRCLAYCSLFPRNYNFKKDNLIEFWLAEGFVQPPQITELGEYFDGLYKRSFFQPSQLGENGELSYKMHDFIHKFAEIVAPGICFRLEDMNDSFSGRWYEKLRHLSFLCTCEVQLHLKKIEKCEGLRTFIVPSGTVPIEEIPYSFFEKLGRLRVLDLSHTMVDKLQESLGRLKLLRYLDLSNTLIEFLPESISHLQLLQVLKLRNCSRLELPRTLNSLTSLEHLDVDIHDPLSMPANIGCLTHLQRLPKFFVGNRADNSIAELKNLNSLRGTLSLVNLENIKDWAEAREAKLSDKRLIKRLELEWSPDFSNRSTAIDVFDGLKPHKDVQELKVTQYAGFTFPTWLTSETCKLVSIHVTDCSLDDVLPALGQLPHLKILCVEGLHRVNHMSYPFSGDGRYKAYPSLKSLKIKDMKSLTRWHEVTDNCMLKLNDLTIAECPKLSSVQSLNLLSSLQTLEINRCPALEALPQLPPLVQSLIIFKSDMVDPEWRRIKSIPSIEIDYEKVAFP